MLRKFKLLVDINSQNFLHTRLFNHYSLVATMSSHTVILLFIVLPEVKYFTLVSIKPQLPLISPVNQPVKITLQLYFFIFLDQIYSKTNVGVR